MEEKEMTFWAHLEDLRWSLVRVIAVLFVFVVVCFCLMPYLFDNFVLAPTTSDFPLYRWLSKLGRTRKLEKAKVATKKTEKKDI